MLSPSDPVVALADELGRLGRRLDAIGAELRVLRERDAPVPPAPWIAPGTAQVLLPVTPAPVPGPPWNRPVPPAPLPGPPAASGPPGPPAAGPASPGSAARQPAPRAPLTAGRVLAWTGAAVTLLGVVLLLALAAARGWFTPPARLGLGALLGIALVGAGLWLHRRETSRTGALALAATGFAALYLVVAASTALYGYLPAVPALLLALVVAAGGIAVADRWRSPLLAGGVLVGAAVLAPALAGGWRLVALVLALQVASAPVLVLRRWTSPLLLAAAASVLTGAVVVAIDGSGPAAAVVAAAVEAGAVLAVLLAVAGAAAGRLPVAAVAGVVAASPLPALIASAILPSAPAAGLAVGAAVVLGGFAALPRLGGAARSAAIGAAIVALLAGTAAGLYGASVTIAILAEALVALVAAAALRDRTALVAGWAMGGIGLMAALLRDAPLRGVVRAAPDAPAHVLTGLVVALLLLAAAAAVLVAGGRVGWIAPDAAHAIAWVPVGLAGLYGAAAAVVHTALLISPTPAGFTAGHAAVTVSWTVAALVLLARGLERAALRIAGLVLVVAAVVKLVLFDLVALDGLARVAAFLGAGLVLLAAGTRYARLVAESEQRSDGSPEP